MSKVARYNHLLIKVKNMSFKILSDCHISTQDHQSILHWIQIITLSSLLTWQHSQAETRNNSRKRLYNKKLHEKLSDNKALKHQKTLAESSDNIITLNVNDSKTIRRSRRLKNDNASLFIFQKLKQFTVTDFTHIQNDENDDETFKISSHMLLQLNN